MFSEYEGCAGRGKYKQEMIITMMVLTEKQKRATDYYEEEEKKGGVEGRWTGASSSCRRCRRIPAAYCVHNKRGRKDNKNNISRKYEIKNV